MKHFQAWHPSSTITLLIHLLNDNVSSKSIDIKLSYPIFAFRKSFEIIRFTRQVGYGKEKCMESFQQARQFHVSHKSHSSLLGPQVNITSSVTSL